MVPEFDIPGHSRGFLPLDCDSDDTDASDCLEFCAPTYHYLSLTFSRWLEKGEYSPPRSLMGSA